MAKKVKTKVEPKKEPTFPKDSLIASKQFSFGDKAILDALLDESRQYTIAECASAIARHKRRRVK